MQNSTVQSFKAPAKIALALLSILILSGVVGAGIAYIAVGQIPCSKFGSSFEGACGFSAMFFAMGVAAILATVLFVSLATMYFRRQLAQHRASHPEESSAAVSAVTIEWWKATFWLTLAAFAADYFLLPNPFDTVVSMSFLLVHCAFIGIVANSIDKKQAILWPALALGSHYVPLALLYMVPVGAIAAFWYLHHVRGIGRNVPEQA